MASSLSHRALAAAMGKLQQEKEERVQKLSREEREKLENATTEKKKELEDLERKKQQNEEDTKRETDDLNRLKAGIQDQVRQAADEQLFFNLQHRIAEFHGSDITTLKQRLLKEGYAEQLVIDTLKLRTLEQLLGKETGMQAAFIPVEEANPLERIMQGSPRLYDMTDRRVLDRLENIRDQAMEKGYLNNQEERFVQSVAYFTNQFQQVDEYRAKDDHGYLTRTSEVAESIKRHLGIDIEASTLSYAGKKL